MVHINDRATSAYSGLQVNSLEDAAHLAGNYVRTNSRIPVFDPGCRWRIAWDLVICILIMWNILIYSFEYFFNYFALPVYIQIGLGIL